MMIFGVDPAAIVAGALSPGARPATLVSVTPGTRTPGSLTAGTNPTTANHACRGWLDDSILGSESDGALLQGATELQTGMDQRQLRGIVLLAATIAGGTVSPRAGDRVTIEGGTYTVVAVKTDLGRATHEIRAY